MAIVTLDKLSKVYDRAQPPVVDRVSLEVGHGELVVLLGPSGCGKTTTLRMIAGLEAISSGTLAIDGRVVNAVPAKDRDIAMVFQSYALYPHMTVRDNLAFGLRRRRIAAAEIERRVAAAAASLGLDGLLARKPYALSGGQRQRVALGRAIVRDPKVFLFDEPLSNLDAALRVSTRAEIAALHRRLGATMIYVTHDQVEAMTLGDRICIMSGGRTAQIGPPMEVYRRPADLFVAGFLGNPPMNLLPAVATGAAGGRGLQLGPLELAAAAPLPLAPGSPLTFGIRPEHVTLEGLRPDGVPVPALVAQVEHLGAETLVTGRVAGLDRPLVARLPGEIALTVETHCRLLIDPAQARLFGFDGLALPP